MKRTYTFTMETNDEGKTVMTRTNDGFSAIELLGITEFISHEIREQIKGCIKPDIINRTVIVEDGKASN